MGGDLNKKVLKVEIEARSSMKIPVDKDGVPRANVKELHSTLIELNGGSMLVKRLSGYDGERKGPSWRPREAPPAAVVSPMDSPPAAAASLPGPPALTGPSEGPVVGTAVVSPPAQSQSPIGDWGAEAEMADEGSAAGGAPSPVRTSRAAPHPSPSSTQGRAKRERRAPAKDGTTFYSAKAATTPRSPGRGIRSQGSSTPRGLGLIMT